ncbi:hypothetical protein FA95DRAFT_1554425 [Auriscalpium vulgare]|uniref:Uncharacterized protein n=1 Tax=Auriscalpium vulgare TaxID=40419 RepID=A0ACB8S5R7_9AGAM|nr:hypothetical protein FA95DRAFT_1554425 [Auriscalpium vulgare]
MFSILFRRSVLVAPAFTRFAAARTFVSSTRLLTPAATTTTTKTTVTTKPAKVATTTGRSKPKSKPKSTTKPKAKSNANAKSKAKPKKKAKSKAKAKPKAKKPVRRVKETARKSPARIRLSPEVLPPKRPVSGYTAFLTKFFTGETKPANLQEGSSLLSRGALAWKDLPDHEKQAYAAESHAQFSAYQEALKTWLVEADPTVIGELNRRELASRQKGHRRSKLLRKPTSYGPPPLNGYLRYQQAIRPAESYDVVAFCKNTSQQWKEMSDVEKAEYMDPYRQELEAWRAERDRVKADKKADKSKA